MANWTQADLFTKTIFTEADLKQVIVDQKTGNRKAFFKNSRSRRILGKVKKLGKDYHEPGAEFIPDNYTFLEAATIACAVAVYYKFNWSIPPKSPMLRELMEMIADELNKNGNYSPIFYWYSKLPGKQTGKIESGFQTDYLSLFEVFKDQLVRGRAFWVIPLLPIIDEAWTTLSAFHNISFSLCLMTRLSDPGKISCLDAPEFELIDIIRDWDGIKKDRKIEVETTQKNIRYIKYPKAFNDPKQAQLATDAVNQGREAAALGKLTAKLKPANPGATTFIVDYQHILK